MDRNKLIADIVTLLQASTMEPKEKAMWLILIPQMEETDLVKLQDVLQKEVSAMTNLYLETIAEQQ
jgi:hypothetical protein